MKTSKKLISLLMCMLMVLTMVPMSVFATVGPIEIDTINIEGVPAPLYGQTIKSYYEAIEAKITDGTITVNDEVYDSTAYKYGNLLDDGWNVRTEADGPLSPTSTDLIKEGTYYVAMWFLPDNGYVIPEDVNVIFDGAKSVKIEVEDDGCLDIRAEFEVEAPAPTEIDTVHIEGIPAPLYGQTVKEYNTVMYNGSMDGAHKINGSTRVNNGEDIFYGNIELADWEYYNSEKSYLAPSSADALPSVYYLVHWLYPAAGYKFADDAEVTVDGAVSVEKELDEDGCLAVWAKFEVKPTEIDTVNLTYDLDFIDLNTFYNENSVTVRAREALATDTVGIKISYGNCCVSYIDSNGNYYNCTYPSKEIIAEKDYYIRAVLMLEDGYDWPTAAKTDEPSGLKIISNGTDISDTVYIKYRSDLNWIIVYAKIGKPSTEPVISGVSISDSAIMLDKGESHSFIVDVYGNADDKTVTWTVEGAVSTNTTVDNMGKLTIGADETADEITVKATSNYNSKKFVTAKVKIGTPTEIDTVHIEGVPAPVYGQTIKSYYEAIEAKITDGTITVNDEVYDSTAYKYGNLFDDGWNVRTEADGPLSSTSTDLIKEGTYYVAMWFYPDIGYVIPEEVNVLFDGAKSVKIEVESDGCLDIRAEYEVEAPPPTEITAVELTVSGYQCGGLANQITFTGSEGTYMIPSTYPVFTDINDFEGTALGKYDGFCRDTEYWVSAAFAAADGYALPELSKDDITLKGFTVLDKYVSYDATEQTIWVAFKLSAHSFDDDSDNTCNLCNKERYTYTEADGKVTITAYNGPGGAVNIPSTIGGYPVTVIGEEAFCEEYDITSVSIPDSVTTIEEDAFYDNELTSVHIGKGVTSIGKDAFAFSEEFETITVDEDNDYYLSENNVLFDIDKEELIVYAVKKTDTSYTVPATVKKIHRAAFNFAKNLKSITISDGVTDIGSFAFSGCENITSLIIPNSVTSIGSYAFSQMDNLKYVIISDKLTTVSSYAFQYCSKLTDVVIPASVTSIEGGAFRYCSSLSDIYYTGTQAQWENVAVNNNAGYHDKFLSANVHYNAQVVYGHVYDNDCDATCNICGDTRETREHTYTDCEDTTCNGCGKARTAPGHDYYDCYDTTCADCDYIRSDVPDHCFEDPCQPYCSDCGVVNPDATAHTYDGDCDDKCNVCDWCRIPPHSYGGDDTCDLCGKGRFIVLDRIDLTIADDSWMPKIGDVYDYDAYLPTVTIQGNIPFEIGHGDDGWRVYDETTGQWFWMEDGDVFEAGKTYQFWWLCINCEEDDVTTLYRLSEDVKVYVNGQQWSIMNMDDDFWCGTESWHAYVYVTAPAITLCGHTYDNACDAVCNKCEEERTVPAHTYKTYTTKATLSKNGKTESKCTVCGKVKSTQTIAKISSVTLSATKYIHDGKNKTPTVTVKDANGKKLIKNTDYKLSVASKRSGIGKYTVKVTFIGKYEGSKNVYFTILPGKPASVKSAAQTTSSVKLTWSKVSGAAGYTVYRYSPSKKAYVKAGTTEGTSLTVKGLLTGTKYTFKVVAYGKTSGGKVYNSEGYTLLKTATKTKTPELTKVTASSTKGKAYVYHSNVSGETGYTVYYSTSKTSGFKKYANFKADTTRCDITKLTSGKTYYFKVRTYIKTDSGYVYSPWSAVKGIKVK